MSRHRVLLCIASVMAGSVLLAGLSEAVFRGRPFRSAQQTQVGKRKNIVRPPAQQNQRRQKVNPHRRRSLQAGITVDRSRRLRKISTDAMGFNMHAVTDVTQSGLANLVKNSRATIVRWPGGTQSDIYHWRTHTMCDGWYPHPNSTFDNFMAKFAQPAGVNVAVTLNYGSNATCSGGGDAADAADWVAHAKQKGYRVKYWTIGNEVYGNWTPDRNPVPHDPDTYARRVAQEYYPQIKAADPAAQVGVVVNPYDLWDPNAWTYKVLRQARYDFMETHYYPLQNATTKDEDLLFKTIPEFRQQIQYLQQAMGGRQVPIMLGEFNNVPTSPNLQTMSIVNGLYTGLLMAESSQLGVSASFPWQLQEDYCTYPASSNFSRSLYGWQNFATYSAFSIGLPGNSKNNCRQVSTTIPFGTPFPAARIATLYGTFARAHEDLLETTISTDYPKVRAYSATGGTGYRMLLFNLDEVSTVNVPIRLSGETRQLPVTLVTYGKSEYDQTRMNRWVSPTRTNLGVLSANFNVTLPPWSVTVVQIGL
jgi:hypothetical protein